MRFIFLAGLFVALAATVSAAPSDKKPKPVDIKKEILDSCGSIPYGVVDLDGKNASKDEMEEGKFQVTSFITQVDVYQDCLLRLQKTLGDRLTPKDIEVIEAAILQSQQEKEAVGKAYNAAVDEFNKTHK